jgi:hypothetical protein
VAQELDRAGAIHALAFSPDGDVLAAGTERGVRLWHAAGWRPGPGWSTDAPVTAVAFIGPRLLATGGQAVRVWDAARGRPLWGLEVSRGPVQALVVDESAGALVVADQGPEVTVFPLPDLHARLAGLRIGISLFPSSRWGLSPPDPAAVPPDHEAWRRRAKEHFDRQEWNPLVWVCTSTLARWPDDAELWLWLGRATARRPKEWHYARAAYDEAVERAPNDPAPLVARAELSLDEYRSRRRQGESRQALRRLLEMAHDDCSRAMARGVGDRRIPGLRDAIANEMRKP